MYNISSNLKQVQKSLNRDVDIYITVNNITTYDKDKIEEISIIDDLISDNSFSLGNVVAKSLKLRVRGSEGDIKSGDLVKPFIKMKAFEDNTWEEVPMGNFYVSKVQFEKGAEDVIILECLDKLGFIDGDYESTLNYPTKLENILKEICNKFGITKVSTAEDITIEKKLYGYTCREVIGFIASLSGCNAKMNRDGKLEFVMPSTIVDTIDCDTAYNFTCGEKYESSGIACYFGDIPVVAGNDSKTLIPYKNPWVNAINIHIAYNKLGNLEYTTASKFDYRGYLNIDAGDYIGFVNLDGVVHKVLVTSHTLSSKGGLAGSIV